MKKLAIIIFSLTASFHALSHNVPELMKQCALEKNALKRLVCFDKISQNLEPLPNEHAPPKQVVEVHIDTPKKTIIAAEPAEDFGLENKSKRKESEDKIVANVISIKKDPSKKYIITLDNGHVWRQNDSTRLKIVVGESVVIKRGSFGSFFMSKDGLNKRLRVKRLK